MSDAQRLRAVTQYKLRKTSSKVALTCLFTCSKSTLAIITGDDASPNALVV